MFIPELIIVLNIQEQDLLSQEKGSKRRLEEANPIIREQAYQQPVEKTQLVSATVGPNFPSMAGSGEPATKRLRLENNTIPPPPPPMMDGRYDGATVLADTQKASMGVTTVNHTTDQIANTPLTTAASEGDSAETKMLSESEFAASLTKPEVTLQIRIPNDPSQMAWNFYGQILSMTVNVMSKVKEVKAELSRTHLNGMPSNKIQFKDAKSGFLNNGMTLASLNIGPTATVELIPKTRGGRK